MTQEALSRHLGLIAQAESSEGSFGAEINFDAVRLAGPGARQFLDGQLSQDMAQVSRDALSASLLLEPNGRLVAGVSLFEESDDCFLLLVDSPYGEKVSERLRRFAIRVKCDISAVPVRVTAFLGEEHPPDALSVDRDLSVLKASPLFPGEFVSVELNVGPWEHLSSYGDAERLYDSRRVIKGIPRQGREILPELFSASLGQLSSNMISFTKGCYTGQELVARMDSRSAQPPLSMCRFEIDEPSQMLLGLERPKVNLFNQDGKEAGFLTTIAVVDGPATWALGFLKRSMVSADDLVGELADISMPVRLLGKL